MATDDTYQNTNPEPESKPSAGVPSTTTSIPLSFLPSTVNEGDTVQVKVVSIDGSNAKVQLATASPAAKAAPSIANMSTDQLRNFLTQEAQIHASDQTNV